MKTKRIKNFLGGVQILGILGMMGCVKIGPESGAKAQKTDENMELSSLQGNWLISGYTCGAQEAQAFDTRYASSTLRAFVPVSNLFAWVVREILTASGGSLNQVRGKAFLARLLKSLEPVMTSEQSSEKFDLNPLAKNNTDLHGSQIESLTFDPDKLKSYPRFFLIYSLVIAENVASTFKQDQLKNLKPSVKVRFPVYGRSVDLEWSWTGYEFSSGSHATEASLELEGTAFVHTLKTGNLKLSPGGAQLSFRLPVGDLQTLPGLGVKNPMDRWDGCEQGEDLTLFWEKI